VTREYVRDVPQASEIIRERHVRSAELYSVVNRAVGYLGGVLLLYRNGTSFDPESIHNVVERTLTEVREAASELARSVDSQETSVVSLAAAAGDTCRAGTIIARSLALGGGGLSEAERALPMLHHAYRLLCDAENVDAGFVVVDRRQACGCLAHAILAERS
jgi:hypothetical protein